MTYQIQTQCIHGDNRVEKNHPYGAVAVPIYQSATFAHPGIAVSTGYDYSRESNPTRTELEIVMSALEGAADTIACASGMAALGLCLDLFAVGDHIICSDDLYGGSVRMFQSLGEKRGLTFSYVDTSDYQQVVDHLQENTKGLYIETPSNPTMKITDLAKMGEFAKQHQLQLLVDNTFLSPYFQNPIKWGADIVIHSGTKFLGGHNDTLAGFVCTRTEKLGEQLRFIYKTSGCCLAPFDSFLLIRGIKTLAVRMEQQQRNALLIAQWLQQQPCVTQVYYVGLPDHPGYAVNQQQATGAGSMIAFRVDKQETARQLLARIKLIVYAESLGGVESLMTYPMLQTHGDVSVEIREKLGITEDFLRLSVGIEDANDLIADLAQALETVR